MSNKDHSDLNNSYDMTPVDYNPFNNTDVILACPSSDAQREIWLSSKMSNKASCAYNQSLSIQLNGQTNIVLLKNALKECVKRHEVLQTNFSPDGKTIYFNKEQSIDILEFECTEQSPEQFLSNIINEEVSTPFNLETDQLVRFRIVKKNDLETVLIVTAHHIICDGWSIFLLLLDISRLYSNLSEPNSNSLPAAFQFSDYLAYTALQHSKELNDELENYWLEQFKDEISPLNLPTDFPRPALRTYNSNLIEHQIADTTTEKIKKIAAQYRCSSFTFFLSGLFILFHRLSNQKNIIIGTPAAAQPLLGFNSLVGHCANFLPIKVEINPNESVKYFIENLQDLLATAYKYSAYSYNTILEKLSIPRDPGRMPLLSIGLTSVQRFKKGLVNFKDLDMSYTFNSRHSDTFEIYMTCVLDENGMYSLQCNYNTDLFLKTTIERWLHYYEKILLGITFDIMQPIKFIPILSEKEILSHVNKLEQSKITRPNQTIHNLFENQVSKNPDKTALTFNDFKITYKELNSKANKLAKHLQSLGANNNTLVGIYIDRSIEMVIALLGVLKSGAAYVPLDPMFPSKRIEYIIESTSLSIVLSKKDLSRDIPIDSHMRIVCVDKDWDIIKKHDANNIHSSSNTKSENHRAYVMFTSGSTGNPKGVMLSHSSVVNFLLSMANSPGINSKDIVLALTTYSFDISILEIFLPLISGSQIVIAGIDDIQNGKKLVSLIDQKKITYIQATPTTWNLILSAGWHGNKKLKALCGGEAFPEDLRNKLLKKVSAVWNMYGPTETTVWSTCYCINSLDQKILIGTPIENTSVYILDQNNTIAPIGVWGELHIGGDGLALGYYNQPELTQDKFISITFTSSPPQRLYKTGDLCRLLENGNIEFKGRIDNQVKIRGFRIELGEIEHVLKNHPDVKDAVVDVKSISINDKQLIAYIIPQKEFQPKSLQKFCKEHVPYYMVPSVYVSLTEFPLTPNKKIDRKSLPIPDNNIHVNKSHITNTPLSKTEKKLLTIWKNLLPVKNFDIDDDFFQLGGHSLLAAQMFLEIEKIFDVSLPLVSLFKTPHIRGLSNLIAKGHNDLKWSNLVPINTNGSKLPLFLIHGAEGNIILYRDLCHNLPNNIPIYGLQSSGLNGKETFDPNFKIVARNYVKAIQSVQPVGPYRLAGYCLGGVIALEIAQQLHKINETVTFLAMIETYNLNETKWPQSFWQNKTNTILNIAYHLANLFSLKNTNKLSFFKHKFSIEIQRINILIQSNWFKMFKNKKGSEYHHINISKLYDLELEKYKPKMYSGKGLLIIPKVNFIGFNDPKWGWESVFKNDITINKMDVYPHGTLVEPYVKEIAEIFTSNL